MSLCKKILIVLVLVGVCTANARVIDVDLSGQSERMAANVSLSSSDPEEIRSHCLEPGTAKVSGLEVGDVIAFKLFADKTLEVTLVEETEALSGRAFLGRVNNALDAIGCVVLETSHGIILDVTDFENKRVWKVVSDANGVTVREIKPEDSRRRGSDTLYRPVGQLPINVSVSTTNGVTTVVTNFVTAARQTISSPKDKAPAATSDETTVDILINYDTDAAIWAKSNGGGLQSFAETCVQKMNTALANTGLTSYFRFRLVGVYEVGGSAGGNLEYALYYSSGIYSGMLNGVNWAGVSTERDRVSADIVCTLCDNGYDYGTVGIGWALMSNSDSQSCGFNACQIRSVANSHTMTHEVGHNMGAGHSNKQADSPGPQYHTYSSGYYFKVGSTKYHTIMAYNADGYGNYYTSVPYFSSPDHKYGGVAVGSSQNDNTRTLEQTCQMVAANRIPPFVSDEVGRGVEAEDYVWTTDGCYPWMCVKDYSFDGIDSSRSCEMGGYTTSWAETKVKGPATLAFKLRLRSYQGRFCVLVDNEVKYVRENEVLFSPSWESVSVAIPSGVHTVRLAYTHAGMGWTSGGNGAWVDSLSFSGGTPAKDDIEDATSNTDTPVPYSWLATYYPWASTSDYERIASQRGANGFYVWESYVAGLVPTDADSVFRAVITFENGVPSVKYEPVLTAAESAKRSYTVYGTKMLGSSAKWYKILPGGERGYNFFKVTVEMK